jgi:hypothetical protein
MGTKLLVAPAVVEIAVMVVSIMVPIPIMVSIMTPIILIETVTIILVKLLPAAACDAMVIVHTREVLLECRGGPGCRPFAAFRAAPSAFRLRRNAGMVLG